MHTKHHEKYIGKLALGMILITTGILMLAYVFVTPALHEEWYLWGLGITIIINTGLLLLGNAFIHKMKADLIRKQKHKGQYRPDSE